jgi:hypothetical protein
MAISDAITQKKVSTKQTYVRPFKQSRRSAEKVVMNFFQARTKSSGQTIVHQQK